MTIPPLGRLLETGAQAKIEKLLCERKLRTFLERAWNHFDPSKFAPNWHIDAVAEHLEAVNRGQIRRLLINFPPRMAKTNLVSIAWPIWTWINNDEAKNFPLLGAQVQFLCVAYGSVKAQEDAVTSRRLIRSKWFQDHWGEAVQLSKDRDNQERYDTSKGGSRISVGIGASIIGRGGNIKIIDDPSKPDEVESDAVRLATIRAYDETLSSRENDPTIAAEVIVAQRLHDMDLPGHVLTKFGSDPSNGGFVHLNLPLEFDPARRCVTVLGWEDPRTEPGESLWPSRFTDDVIAQRKKAEGTYSFSAKYNQNPVPRGGGIIKPEWWQSWPPEGEKMDRHGKPLYPLKYPQMDYIVAYVDTALTEKKENDPSGMTVYGVWRSPDSKPFEQTDEDGRIDTGLPLEFPNGRVMLMQAWEEWLGFPELVRKVLDTCRRRKVDRLIIEAKTAGYSLAQELAVLCSGETFSVMLDRKIQGDKDSRLRAVSNFFEQGLVYAPNRAWADKVIDQCSAGSKGQHDELADCTSGTLRHLRKTGELRTLQEHAQDLRDEFELRPSEPLYDV